MTLDIMAFGITKDIVGSTLFQFELESGTTVKELKTALEKKYPEIKALKSLLIAVNEEYGNENQIITATDEIALIPPVSGG
jgi:molybdopterin synthase sulfur carrier subunit